MAEILGMIFLFPPLGCQALHWYTKQSHADREMPSQTSRMMLYHKVCACRVDSGLVDSSMLECLGLLAPRPLHYYALSPTHVVGLAALA